MQIKYLFVFLIASVKLFILPFQILPLRITLAYFISCLGCIPNRVVALSSVPWSLRHTQIASVVTQTFVPFYLLMALNTPWRSRILLNWLAKGTFWCALWKQMYSNSDNVIGIFTQGYQIVRHGRETRRLLGVLSKRLVYQAFPAVRSLLLQSLLLLCTISIRCNYAHCSGLRVSTTSCLDSPLMNSHFTE